MKEWIKQTAIIIIEVVAVVVAVALLYFTIGRYL